MPELPEVQTIVNDLKKKITGRPEVLRDVWFDSPRQIFLVSKNKIIKTPKQAAVSKILENALVSKIERRGKNILIHLSKGGKEKKSELILWIHLKMTGFLFFAPASRFKEKNFPGRKHFHFILYFKDQSALGLSDVRKFAKIVLGSKKDIGKLFASQNLGPEPLSLNFKNFREIIGKQKRKIKVVLMDQKIFAGIGNIYADEILWQAKINPRRTTDNLKEKEIKKLFRAVKFILKKAIRLRGSSVSDYRDTSGEKGKYADVRAVYRRTGERCRRCGASIQKIKIGGRATHFCPHCQK